MAYTLSNVIRDALIELGQLQAGTATGGSATQMLDSVRNGAGRDNSWKGGTAIVIKTDDNAAPMNEFARVTASAAATWSLTFAALTAAVEANDKYAFAGIEYPLDQMIVLVNKALKKFGDIELVDDTTLSTSSSTTEYAAEVEWKRPNGPSRIDIAHQSTDGDRDWTTAYDWEYIPGTAGSGGFIRFKTYPYNTNSLRVWYNGPHPELWDYDDPIDGRVQPEAIIQATVTEALDWNNTKIRGGDKYLLQRQNKAEDDYFTAKAEAPRTKKAKRSKLLIIDHRTKRYPGDRTPRE